MKKTIEQPEETPGTRSKSQECFGLYLVITNPLTSYEKCAEAAVCAGLRYVQLRMKNVPTELFVSTARNIRSITNNTTTRFIVNDMPEIAVAVNADGVHLGQDDMPLPVARERFPQLRIFGLSTHNHAQAQSALALSPDYCGVGPVFATPTKAIPDPVLGVVTAADICRTTPLPTVAIGGINRQNLAQVLNAGATNFAVVRDVCLSPQPYDVICELQNIWHNSQ